MNFDVNTKIHGFTVTRTVPLAELDAELIQMTHDRTGLSLVWLRRDEENKTFGIAFKTLPWNDTGVFHILEHSVLCGSQKYPVKEPFVELLKNSMNTFLNALTFPDKTFYPISSRNDKDFLNLTRVYLDAVFRPAIYEKPEIFGQEGWHYEFDANGAPGYKGVVFNEMKGAFADADELTCNAMNRALFPNTPYAFVSGGDPAHIPDLTYEEFIRSHRRFYAPSNAYVYLDGALDIHAVLALLNDEYLSAMTRTECPNPMLIQPPVDGGTQQIEYEIGADEDETGKMRMAWGSVIGTFADREKLTAIQALADVLCGSNQAPLNKAILSQGLAEEVSLRVNDGVAQPWAQLEVRNFRADRREAVEQTIRATLEKQVRDGIDRAPLDAALANLEFQLRERDYGSYPQGLIFGFSALESWLYGGAPEANLEGGDLFERLRAKIADGYFEQLIRDVLLENPHCCRVVLTPSKTLGAERRKREAERLAREAAAWSEADKAHLRARQQTLEAWQHSADTPEQLATLPHLQLADVSAQPERLATETGSCAGLPVLGHAVNSNGIVYASLYFNVEDCAEAELPPLSFLCELLGKTAPRRSSVEQLTNRTRLLCGNLSFDVASYQGEAGVPPRVKLCVRFSALEHRLTEAVQLVAEILTETLLDDEAAVRDILRQVKMTAFEQLVMAGHRVAIGRVNAQYFASGVADECANGFAAYQWFKSAEEHWNWAQLRPTLAALLHRVFVKNRLTVSITGDADRFAPAVAELLAAALPEGTAAGEMTLRPWGVRRERITIPADIAFAARGGNIGAYSGALPLAARIVSLAHLWNVVRVQGGAYGVGLLARDSGLLCCYSYRDPNGAQSLQKYLTCGDFLRTFAAGAPDLTGFIIGAVSDASPLLTPRLKGATADSFHWRGLTHERRCALRHALLHSAPGDLVALADRMESTLAAGGVCIIGGANQVEHVEADVTWSV